MTSIFPHRQSGLSLVELMVAMALSLLLMLGVIQIFLSSKQTYSTNSALSRVQESGRFAMNFLTQDIRNTGYKGQCLGEPISHLQDDEKEDGLWTLEDPLEGWNNVDNDPLGHLTEISLEGSDVIRINFAAGSGGVKGVNSNDTTTDAIHLGVDDEGNPYISGVDQHAIILISNAMRCDLFRNIAAKNDTSVEKATGGSAWSDSYTSEMEVLALQNATYYIRANNNRPNSLARQRLSSNSTSPTWVLEELVEGIQDMQISYGIADINRQVIHYDTADAVESSNNWESVAAVRIDLLAVSADTGLSPERQIYDREKKLICFKDDSDADCDEANSIDIPDRRLAQVFSTTIGIRNRLP